MNGKPIEDGAGQDGSGESGAGRPCAEAADPHAPETTKQDLLKIGDFARLAGTNLRTLRYYEEVGILLPTHRSAGGFRYYRETDVNRLRMAQSLQDLGLSLEEIAELLATRDTEDGRTTVLSRVRGALARQEELLEERLSTLEAQREAVRTARAKLTECEQCRHVPSPDNNFCEPCPIDHQKLPVAISALF